MSLKQYSPPTYPSYAWKTTMGYLSERPIVGLLSLLGLGIGTILFQLADSWEPAVAELLRFVVFIVGGGFSSFVILYVLSIIDAPRCIRCEMLDTIREFEEAQSPARVSAKLSLETSGFRMPDNGSHVGLVKVTNWNETAVDIYGVPLGVYHEDDGFRANRLEFASSLLRWINGAPADKQRIDSRGGVGHIEIANVHRDRDTNEDGMWLTYRHGATKLEKGGRFKIEFELRGKLAGRDIEPIPYAVMLGHEERTEPLFLTKWPEHY